MGNRKEHKIENEVEIKHCPTCDSWKDLSEYNKQSSSWDKLARMCRKCYCEYKTNKRKMMKNINKVIFYINKNMNNREEEKKFQKLDTKKKKMKY